MKTAMQELIENILVDGSLFRFTDDTNVSEFVNKALEKEKEQIIKDYHEGQMSLVDLYKESFQKIGVYEEMFTDFEDAEEYYNQTYNQNK
jgi:hypothetical protein